MRILHLIDSIDPSAGGPVEGLRQLCYIYREGGHQIEVASMDSADFVGGCEFPAPVAGLGPGWGIYGYSRRAVSWIKANLDRFDLVMINGVWQYNAVAGYWAMAGSDVPYVVIAHGMLDPYFNRGHPLKHFKKWIYWHVILRKILAEAAAVFFTCEEEKLLARQSFSPYRVREAVIPYGSFGPECDLPAAAGEFLATWPQLSGKRLAVSIGRIHPKKGTDILIEAFAGSLARDPAWHLVIAGPDQIGWKAELETLATRLGVADRITWTGMVRGSMKWGAFAAAEVFVLPSHQENFGIVVAEALSCGLPVIVSNGVNIWREIEGSNAGLVCDDTIADTTRALEDWSKLSADQYAELRAAALRCFEHNFNLNTAQTRVLNLIDHMPDSTADEPPKA